MRELHATVQLLVAALRRGRLVLASTPRDWAIAEPTLPGDGDEPFTLHVNGSIHCGGKAYEVAYAMVDVVGSKAAREAAAGALLLETVPNELTQRSKRTA